MAPTTLSPRDRLLLDMIDGWRSLVNEAIYPPETGYASRELLRFCHLSLNLMIQAKHRRPDVDTSSLARLARLDPRQLWDGTPVEDWVYDAACLIELLILEATGKAPARGERWQAGAPVLRSPAEVLNDLVGAGRPGSSAPEPPAAAAPGPETDRHRRQTEALLYCWNQAQAQGLSREDAFDQFNALAAHPGSGLEPAESVDAMKSHLWRHARDRMASFPRGRRRHPASKRLPENGSEIGSK